MHPPCSVCVYKLSFSFLLQLCDHNQMQHARFFCVIRVPSFRDNLWTQLGSRIRALTKLVLSKGLGFVRMQTYRAKKSVTYNAKKNILWQKFTNLWSNYQLLSRRGWVWRPLVCKKCCLAFLKMNSYFLVPYNNYT